MMITSNSYTFVEKKSSEDWHVKIKEGEFKGIVYRYGRIEVAEDKSEDTARLKFNFAIEEIPKELEMSKEELQEDLSFLNTLGNILTHIIEDAMDSGKYKIGNDDKSTDSESTVH
jgi:DNA-directed RNA polymerase specialized sigma subunit